jgi:hypothetical protein
VTREYVSCVAPLATPAPRVKRARPAPVVHSAEALAVAAQRRTAIGGDSLPKRTGALALGLVPSTTSETGARIEFEIDRFKVRAKRMRKSIITAGRLHVEEATKGGFRGAWAMLTLTYRDGVDALPRHISGLLSAIRMHLSRRGITRRGSGFRFVWALELTKRLRPHYHVLIRLPRGISLPKPDKRGWWQHGLTRIEWARNAIGYLAKYASKFTEDCAAALPKGMRTHGVGGLNPESKRELRWWKAPTEAREQLGAAADIRKVLGGYADKNTGLYWPSPWHVFITKDGRTIAWKEVTA